MNRGFTDRAAEKDSFGIERYITGLSDFIITCNTPMTIAVQGDWGTGKTSIMKMIHNKLKEKQTAEMIWFNTWQFSQFDMGNDLALSLISCLLDEFAVEDESSEKIKKFLGHIGRFAKNATVMIIDSNLGGKVADKVESALDGDREKLVLPKEIKDLKGEFEKCVKKTLENKNKTVVGMKKDRVVIFVDDLDRLQPAKAVELLEVLKLFLDCENCVFVLAIDYGVVSRGVEEKYGQLIGEKKGKSFFDKIIQVPFKMPVASYNITNYVEECFKEIGIRIGSKEELNKYVSLIQLSIGYNPRSMKRMFNAFLLLKTIATDELLTVDKNKQMLFAVLCLQQSFEAMYDYIVSYRNDIDAEWMIRLSNREDQDIKKYMDDKEMLEGDQESFFNFMNHFTSLLDSNNTDEFEQEEIDAFVNVLNFSTITSADSSGERRKGERQPVNSLEELINKTKTIDKIQNLFKLYEQKIKSFSTVENIETRFFVGQSAASFYLKTINRKSKKFCEIKLNKTSLTLFLVQKTTQDLIDQIENIRPGITNRIDDAFTQINGIVDEEKIDVIMSLIRNTYDLIYGKMQE